QLLHLLLEQRIAQGGQAVQRQRQQQRGGHDADGRRQADEAVVEVGEQRGEADEGSDEVEHWRRVPKVKSTRGRYVAGCPGRRKDLPAGSVPKKENPAWRGLQIES